MMVKKKRLIWIHCDSYETEMKVRDELAERGWPKDIVALVSYGDEIAIRDPKDFIKRLQELIDKFKQSLT